MSLLAFSFYFLLFSRRRWSVRRNLVFSCALTVLGALVFLGIRRWIFFAQLYFMQVIPRQDVDFFFGQLWLLPFQGLIFLVLYRAACLLTDHGESTAKTLFFASLALGLSWAWEWIPVKVWGPISPEGYATSFWVSDGWGKHRQVEFCLEDPAGHCVYRAKHHFWSDPFGGANLDGLSMRPGEDWLISYFRSMRWIGADVFTSKWFAAVRRATNYVRMGFPGKWTETGMKDVFPGNLAREGKLKLDIKKGDPESISFNVYDNHQNSIGVRLLGLKPHPDLRRREAAWQTIQAVFESNDLVMGAGRVRFLTDPSFQLDTFHGVDHLVWLMIAEGESYSLNARLVASGLADIDVAGFSDFFLVTRDAKDSYAESTLIDWQRELLQANLKCSAK